MRKREQNSRFVAHNRLSVFGDGRPKTWSCGQHCRRSLRWNAPLTLNMAGASKRHDAPYVGYPSSDPDVRLADGRPPRGCQQTRTRPPYIFIKRGAARRHQNPHPFHCNSSLRKLLPCLNPKPKFSATVCPASARLVRVPRSTACATTGPNANTGTYSREWSVEGVTGSQP